MLLLSCFSNATWTTIRQPPTDNPTRPGQDGTVQSSARRHETHRKDGATQRTNSTTRATSLHNATRLLPTPRNVNASSQRTSLHYLVALSTTNTRGDCIICTPRELPTTAYRARTATLYCGSRPSPEHYVTCARRQRPTSLPCFGRSTSHIEVPDPVSMIEERVCKHYIQR